MFVVGFSMSEKNISKKIIDICTENIFNQCGLKENTKEVN